MQNDVARLITALLLSAQQKTVQESDNATFKHTRIWGIRQQNANMRLAVGLLKVTPPAIKANKPGINSCKC
jgi:hypothetical protein